jgi:hypothetical protein
VSAGRARDILDILLIDALGKLDYSQTRRVGSERFQFDAPSRRNSEDLRKLVSGAVFEDPFDLLIEISGQFGRRC